MTTLSRDSGLPLSERIREKRSDIAAALTGDALDRSPDMKARFGESGVQRMREDYGYILDYLAVALDLRTGRPFHDFCRWTTGVLSRRGLPPASFAGALGHVHGRLSAEYGPEFEPQAGAWIEEARRQVLDGSPDSPPAPPPAEDGLTDVRERFLEAVLHGDRKTALRIVREALDGGVEFRAAYERILGRTLRDIGSLWEQNRISVADEHLATAAVQSVLSHLYPELPVGETKRGLAVITGVERELHQIGANIIADLLEGDGWDVRFLGTNVPAPAVVGTLNDTKADILGVSMTMLFHLPALRRLVAMAKEARGPEFPVILGGGSVGSAPEIVAETGADLGVVEIEDAIRAFRSIAGG